MKTIKLIFLGLFLLLQNGIEAQGTGEIHGIVLEQGTNDPLFGANVKVYYAGNLIGTSADMDGKFQLVGLAPATYTLEVSFVGKNPTSRTVKVKSSQIAFRDTVFLSSGVNLITFDVVDKIELDPEEPSKPQMDFEQLKNMPGLKNPMQLLSIISDGAISTNAKEGQVYFRGSRTNGIITYLDGMKIVGTIPSFPSNAIKSIAVYTGGVPAKYGDTTGGVVVIETKSYFDWFNKKMARERAERGTTYP